MGTGAAHFMVNSGTTLQGREKERKRGTPKLLPLAYKCLALPLRLVHYYVTRKPYPATSKHGPHQVSISEISAKLSFSGKRHMNITFHFLVFIPGLFITTYKSSFYLQQDLHS